ncbi:MAG: class I SAM-dependent RNA methyltransferase, partial [Spirochaetaceae bacterium]|nr:class I SAM-dependent RNA methyltransferase [Spirochaetaceae bacterium]
MKNTDKLYTACAFCAVGAEKICSNEIRKLNVQAAPAAPPYTILDTGWGRVHFQTGLAGLYQALFALRTADRIMLRLARYDAPDFDALFDGIKNTELENFIPREAGIVISKVRSNRSKLAAETSIQAVSHKAAAERLCAAYGLRRLPEPAPGASCELRVFLEKDKAELLLDLSGAPLFKRGYRQRGGAAPLRETTAAALLLACGWRRKYPLYDPYCGSGTIAIEAALYACDFAPNLLRPFALDRLLVADNALREQIRAALLGRIRQDAVFSIWGSDTDGEAITTARQNIQQFFAAAGLSPASMPVFYVQPADKAKTYGNEPGFVVTNPPYGRRLGTPEE